MDNLEALEALAEQQAAQKAASKAAPTGRPSASSGDADIKDMLAEVDLLRIVQTDTGEQGTPSGDRVDFAHCPVCGHNGCFSFYPESNSWYCFGASNDTGYTGGSALEYYKATRRADDTEAVTWLRDVTGHPFKQKADTQGDKRTEGGDGLRLPRWDSVRAADPPPRNPPLIHGVLRRGHIMLLAGKGKGSKTWSAIQCAVAVATGGDWFGFKCEQGRVLYIDPELDRKSLDNRFSEVCKVKGADAAEVAERVDKWSLRGVLTYAGSAPTVADLAHDVAAICERGDFALVVIDSASCFIEGDENTAGDVRRYFAHVQTIAERTGAAVLVIHHMGKGAKGDWDSIDRSRGSAVWGDAPDAPLSLLEIFPPSGEPSDYLQEGERAFILEDSGLREFPSIEPKRLIFGYPVHRVDTEGITDDWRPKSGQQQGGKSSAETRKAKAEADRLRDEGQIAAYFIRKAIGAEGAPVSEVARDVFGSDRADRVYRVIGHPKDEAPTGEVFAPYKPSDNRCLVVPLKPPPSKPRSLDL